MQQDATDKRIEAIFEMFDSFAKRDFSYRIPISSRSTYADAIAVYLNLIADDLETYLRYNDSVGFGLVSLPDTSKQPAELLAEYIRLHLEEPLPTLKALARMFFTNERKLKESFKALYHTSIYRYYNQERLRKAQLLVLQTKLPLNEIATSCGFNTYHNFSTAFRKYFGHAPIVLRQQ
ncbi:helix-turn-helix domain-containing protein [Flavobacterium sp.]|uniref:helix-turn-helix domain-containing protein n=1 Tax=Flavobacterium sp. TaxID=239 RepID=UPI0039E6215B